MASNRGRRVRVTTAAFLHYGDKHSDWVCKEMYGAKL